MMFAVLQNIMTVAATFFLATFLGFSSCLATPVTDEIGRRVDVVRFPQRIVSLAPGITETLYALGLDEQIVGVTTFCDWPAAARKKPRVGGFINPSVEKLSHSSPI